MDNNSYKTIFLNKNTVDKQWVLVDANAQTLGRMSSEIAKYLRGKYKPSFTPHVDCGDNVVVINADKIRLSGKKWTDKEYIRHTGYPGGQRSETPLQVKQKSSSIIIEKAVRGMLPDNRLRKVLFNNLFIYNGSEHPHEAQNPKLIKL